MSDRSHRGRRVWLCWFLSFAAMTGSAQVFGDEPQEAVVLLHGIMNKPFVMDKLATRLKKEGYRVYNWGYPSTDGMIEDHARRLHAFVDKLPEPRVHYVGFSQGAIIIRYTHSHYPPTRPGRIVMIAPPNHGCEIAEDFYRYRWFRGLYGDKSIKQLFAKQNDFLVTCGTPPGEFGIIAGGKGDGRGYSRRIPGDDDGTISVASASLEGAKDFIVIPHQHTPLVFSRETGELVLSFLKSGHFSYKERKE